MKRFLVASLTLISLVAAAGESQAKPVILVSVEPVALIVRELCQDDCAVTTILPKGVSEHSWQPGPKDMIAAKGAAAVVAIGLELDNRWMQKLSIPAAKVLWLGPELAPMGWWSDDLSGGAKAHAHHDHGDHKHSSLDPHIWTDAGRMRKGSDIIARHLIKSGVSAETLTARSRAIADRLLKIEVMVEGRRKMWRVRPVVVFHDLVGYFARRYNIPVLAVATGSAGHDLSAKMIADVHRRFAGVKMSAILVEHENGASRNLSRELKIPARSFDFAAARSYKNYDEWFLSFVDTWESIMRGESP